MFSWFRLATVALVVACFGYLYKDRQVTKLESKVQVLTNDVTNAYREITSLKNASKMQSEINERKKIFDSTVFKLHRETKDDESVINWRNEPLPNGLREPITELLFN